MGESSTDATVAKLITTPSLLLTCLLVVVCVVSWSTWGAETGKNEFHEFHRKGGRIIPFVVLRHPEWKDISRALEQYQDHVASIMNGLSRSMEVAQTSEWDLFGHSRAQNFLTHQLQQRIQKLAPLLQENEELFRDILLKEFPVVKVICHEQVKPHPKDHDARGNEQLPPQRVIKTSVLESSSYDSVAQVMAHMTRDWTLLGKSIRERTYDWCRRQVKKGPILVPGAGLGRLSYDLALQGFSVEANDSSLIMASAAHAILQRRVKGSLRPFLMDYFTNEVNSEWRYDSVSFPDTSIANRMRGSLSYSIGDFVETYSSVHEQYGGIVTCFFLDTATNIYEYLSTIYNSLKIGGVWVNIGPLQWHRNAVLHPSVNELKDLVIFMGFQIQHWSIDTEAMDYRFDDKRGRSTKYELYKPLRIVAVKQQSSLVVD